MKVGGRRYPLIIYREIVDRWWPMTLVLAIALAILAWPLKKVSPLEPWRWQGLLFVSGSVVVFSVLLIMLSRMAYVQAYPTYIKLKTPFLRVNISYKRVRRYITTEFRTLFPPNKLRRSNRDVVAPIGGKTALVLELTGWPADPKLLRLFLSPLFFKDKTPHFVILVDNWMGLSAEIDSKRTTPKESGSQPRTVDRSILGKLPRRDQ